MKNFITILALTLIMSTGLMSCAALEGFFGEGTVFTTSDQLLEGEVGAIIPFDQLPDSVKAKIPEGTSLVMASKEQLKVDAAFVPAGGEIDGEAVGGIIDSVLQPLSLVLLRGRVLLLSLVHANVSTMLML